MASKIAQLHNVAAFATLLERLIEAPMGTARMGCFYGNSGWGKTTAVSAAQIVYDVVAIEVIENTSKMDVLEQILEQIQITVRRDVPSRIREVAKYLERTGRPLVIDDAQYLIKRNLIGLARDIYNTAGGVVPIVLVGEERLPQSLTKVENVHNRISAWIGAEPCSLSDAQRISEAYAEGVAIDDGLLAEFVTHANGNVRRVVTMIGEAAELAYSNGMQSFSRADWGERPFFDGAAPTARRVEELRPKMELVAPGSSLRAVAK